MKFLVAFSAIVAMAYAEADPFYGYGYAGAYGLGYHGLGYLGVGLKSAPCVNAANVPVPCAHGVGLVHYGKREAEAEADPFYGYGYAGLGYAAPAVVAAAPAVVAAAPAAVVHNAVLGT